MMEKPIVVYKFSLGHHIRGLVIILVISILLFVWWLDIKDVKVFMFPVGFLVIVIGLSSFYASMTKEKTSIKVFESGIYLENEFVSWQEVSEVNLREVEIDTISYYLVVYKSDGSKLESSLNFMNEESDVILRSILRVYERHS